MSNLPAIEQSAPDFFAENSQGDSIKLADYLGKWVVLYFYPKDNTPGCTTEAQNFSELKDQFLQLNAEIVGVSPDSIKSHQKFIDKRELTVELLSDPEHQIAEDYGIWGTQEIYGERIYGNHPLYFSH